MSTYVTVQGDMWDTIAYKATGTTACMDKLIKANISLREYFIFPAGVEITVPDFEETDLENVTPPWKEAMG